MAEKIITISEGQSIYDVTLQEYGDLEALFSFLEGNDLTINTDLKGGLQAKVLDTDIVNKLVVNQFGRSGATAGGGLPFEDPLLTAALHGDFMNYLVEDNINYLVID